MPSWHSAPQSPIIELASGLVSPGQLVHPYLQHGCGLNMDKVVTMSPIGMTRTSSPNPTSHQKSCVN